MHRYGNIILTLACCGAIATACERKRDDSPADPGRDLKQGIKDTGDALQRGAQQAGQAIERGVQKAAPTIKDGVKDLGATVERGVEKAGPAIEKGVAKVGHALQQGVKATGAALSADDSEKPTAEAVFESYKRVNLDGEAKFYEQDGKVRVVVSVVGAPPGEHGVQIHEHGDCSDLKGKSPDVPLDRKQHKHRIRAMGDLDVDEDGSGQLEVLLPRATLKDGHATLMGKAIVIDATHADGNGTSGSAADPIACGVIKKG